MQNNYFVKCPFCAAVADVKYQVGYSNQHPIRYRCKCGVTIRGEYRNGNGVSFENATILSDDVWPDFVVHSSGEFLTVPPYIVNCEKDIMQPTTFILATERMNYSEFMKELEHVLEYRNHRWKIVRAINELYASSNKEVLIKTINTTYRQVIRYLPLNTDMDISRVVFMINQFQFLDYDGKGVTKKVTDLFISNFEENRDETNQLVKFVNDLNYVKDWNSKIFKLCNQVFEKIDLLLPAIGVDYYKENREEVLSGGMSITTTSFEEIKQLYVDLYELTCAFAIVLIGLDNIILRKDYDAMRPDIEISLRKSIKNLTDVSGMKNKGNILKVIDFDAPFESLISDSLNSNIRNAIGHFSYDSDEIAGSYGQKIRFYDGKNKTNCTEQSLVQICHDIWHMYKSLGVFNEVLYRIEMLVRAANGETLSIATDYALLEAVLKDRGKDKKLYPNDPCPCGSGKKYKKCCGKNT